MQVNFDENEVAALINALNYYLPQLREEIGRTENYDMRAQMHAEENALTSVVSKLGGSISTTNTSDIGADNPPWGGRKR
jgi:hypothetical protein